MKLKTLKSAILIILFISAWSCIDKSGDSLPREGIPREIKNAFDSSELESFLLARISFDRKAAFETLPFDIYLAGLADKPGLLKLLSSDSADIRALTVSALRFSHTDVSHSLLSLLDDDSIEVRIAAADCLACRGEKEGLEKLLTLAFSKDDPNRDIAVDSLFNVREMWILHPLHKYLQDNWDSIYLSGNHIKLMLVFRKLAGWYYYEKANLSFYSVVIKNGRKIKDIQTLGIMGTNSSVPALVHIINSEGQHTQPKPVFKTALESLAVIPSPQAMAFLISKIKDKNNTKASAYKKAIENSYRYHAFIIEHMDENTAIESLQMAGLFRHTAFRVPLMQVINKRMKEENTSSQMKSIIRNVNKQLNEK